MTKTFFQRWEHWWCRSAPPHALALTRIAVGVFLLIEALTYIPAVPALLSTHGLVFPLWSAVPGASVAWLTFALYCLCCILLALGCLMRTSLIGLIALYCYYWNLSFHFFPSSYHRLFFVVLLVLLISGADKTFSLRMLRTRGSFFAWEPISILPQRLLAAQITATYLGVGWQKMWLPDWQNGLLFYYSFTGKWGSPPAFALARVLPLWSYDALNWVTRILEFFLPFLLWMRSWRLFAVIAGTLFHVSIAILLGIWWFLLLPPAYILFVEPEHVYAWLRRYFPRFVNQ